MSKQTRQERIEEEVSFIMENAAAGGDNKLEREITFAQAVSIRLRSLQIQKEISDLAKVEAASKAKEVEQCYKQRGSNG